MPSVKVKENEPFDVALRRFKRSLSRAFMGAFIAALMAAAVLEGSLMGRWCRGPG
jgi:hypothetical protein